MANRQFRASEFLEQRRKLVAKVIQAGYRVLASKQV